MSPQIIEYIKSARKLKASDEDIKAMLTASGWPAEQIEAALKVKGDLPLPPPPPPPSREATPASATVAPPAPQPVPVVTSYSTRGFEFWIMFLSMAFLAGSLGWILHSLNDSVFGQQGFYAGGVSIASSALLVSLPIFVILFLRLKKAELADSNLRHDPSRTRAVQLTLIVTFLIGIGKIIWYLYSLFNGTGIGVNVEASPAADFVHTLITIGIAGGIFGYYWHDQHRKD